MSHAPDPHIPDRTTLRFLAAAGGRERRSVDSVIDRLRQPDGAVWLDRSLARALATTGGAPAAAELIEAPTPLARLEELKKSAVAGAEHGADRPDALALYFAVLAAGLVHHARLLTRQPGAVVAETLVDLADASPAPWSAFFRSAAESVE
jgi:hypothetical protein